MRVFIKGGRELTSKELVSWSKNVQELGAGEILLVSPQSLNVGALAGSAGFDIVSNVEPDKLRPE